MSRSGPWPHALVAVVALGAAAFLARPATPLEVAEQVTIQDPAITEASGLVARGTTLVTMNDSGGQPVLYALDAGSGRTVGRTRFTSEPVQDLEALAPGRGGSVWVGDIGDNRRSRRFVSLYDVPAAALDAGRSRGASTVEARRFDLVYPGRPQDAEALLADPRTGRLYVVSKGFLGAHVYAAPARLRADRRNRLTEVGPAGGTVTDGSFTRDGRHVLLRDYDDAWVVDPTSWETLARMPLPSQKQGEALAVTSDPGQVVVTSEGIHPRVITLELSDALRRALAPRTAQDRTAQDQTAQDRTAQDQRSGPHLHRRVLKAVALLLVLAGFAIAAGVQTWRRRR